MPQPNPLNNLAAGITRGLQNVGLGYVDRRAKDEASELYKKTLKSLDALLSQYHNPKEPPTTQMTGNPYRGIVGIPQQRPEADIEAERQRNQELAEQNLYKAYFKGADRLSSLNEYGKEKAGDLAKYLTAMMGDPRDMSVHTLGTNLYSYDKKANKLYQLTNNPDKANYENIGLPLDAIEKDGLYYAIYSDRESGTGDVRQSLIPITKEQYDRIRREQFWKNNEDAKQQNRIELKGISGPRKPSAPKGGTVTPRTVDEAAELSALSKLYQDGFKWESMNDEQRADYSKRRQDFQEKYLIDDNQLEEMFKAYGNTPQGKDLTKDYREFMDVQEEYVREMDTYVDETYTALAISGWNFSEFETALQTLATAQTDTSRMVAQGMVDSYLNAIYQTLGSNYGDFTEEENRDRYRRFFNRFVNPLLSKHGFEAIKY